MDAKDLIARALAQRETWVELGGGKEVKVRRPPAAECLQFRAGVKPETWLQCCVDWRGFTEADVLGAAIGSGNSVVPFDEDLWVVLALDRLDWIGAVSAKVIDGISAHFKTKAEAEKN